MAGADRATRPLRKVTEQRIQGNRNVQIQHVVGSPIRITYDDSTRSVPLEPAHVPVADRLPSPARLVRAHAGVIPYVDRAGLLPELEAWIDSAAPFSGQVIGGSGGSGKTRLAVELCLRLQESEWLCGFLSRIADPGMLDALVDAPTARLVVIDYAEARREQIELLLPLLSAKATAEEPVRALLLVRGGGEAGDDWASRLAGRVDALDAVLDECSVRRLEDAPFGLAERRELFEVAVPALAKRLDRRPAPGTEPGLEDDVFGSPLMVVIAAYLAAHGEVTPTTREGLLDEVLAHERRHWLEGSADLGADDVLLERMVAVATLARADSEAQAIERLRLLPELHDASAERRARLARWVGSQYPGPRWWNPLEPDLVGEHLVARCFAGQADVLRGVVAGSDPDELARPLEVLTRAAPSYPDLSADLGPIFSEELTRLCETAVAQAAAIEQDDLLRGSATTIAAALDRAISAVRVDTDALLDVVDLMPLRADLMLNDLAATLTAQVIARSYRPPAEADPVGHAPGLGRALNDLSVRLSNAGREAEALAAIEEAVAIYRSLAAASSAQYGPTLATALNQLSNCLVDVGRNPEALSASEEVVEIRRPLAEAKPEEFAPELASALQNVSHRHVDAGRHPEALAAIEESVGLYRPLAAAEPDAYASRLAAVLGLLAKRLEAVGREEEAEKARLERDEAFRQAFEPAADVNL